MSDARRYRFASIFFAFVIVALVACLPHAINCCSRFSADELAIRASFGNNGWAPGITPVAVALLDWPMAFRLLIMSIVAATLCLLATVTLLLLSRRSAAKDDISLMVGQAILGPFMVGVLYVLAAYAVGFVGYRGPKNAIWFVGVPMLVAFIQSPRLSRTILWTFPLLLGGWFCMAVLSMTAGIPLD